MGEHPSGRPARFPGSIRHFWKRLIDPKSLFYHVSLRRTGGHFSRIYSSDRHRVTTTLVPTRTRWKRSITSSLRMRMQPYEAKEPIESGRFVP